MVDFSDRSGPPPSADEFRAAFEGKIPADMPITAALIEQVIQAGEERTGDRDRDLGRTLSLFITAIGNLERRIIDGE